MDLPINQAVPKIMHIDLNSCFATVIQQAHIGLRNRPLVIAAYTGDNGCILASSIEAKKLGIKTGMRVAEAKKICPDCIVRENDPDLVRDVSRKFLKICHDYSPDVVPKSIDELVIDFYKTGGYHKKPLNEIGKEIKKRFREEIGEWISCNIGIATNRFLSKLAASLHKPDGLDIIDVSNLKTIYSSLSLTDLNGINVRYQYRLSTAGIFNPLDFLNAKEEFLRKRVFKSIAGHYWYLRLRGFEVDDYPSNRKSYGQEYSLGRKTGDPVRLAALIMMLAEKMGRRLRASGQTASAVHIGILYDNSDYWHKSKDFRLPLYTTQELFEKIMLLFSKHLNRKKTVRKISVSCFNLAPFSSVPLSLFEDERTKKHRVSQAVDMINDKYGEYVIVPALMIKSRKIVIDRIAFGGLK